MEYDAWLEQMPSAFTEDPLWRLEVYRHALFVGDLAWRDAKALDGARRWSIADQLLRAAGSVSANIAEGFSRPTMHDRTRFYAFALGSAREARDWYFKARHVLGNELVAHRINALSRIAKQLIALQRQQGRIIKEQSSSYDVESDAPPAIQL